MGTPQATEDRLVSLAEVWNENERVVPREKPSAAVEVIAAFVPETDDDAATVWRADASCPRLSATPVGDVFRTPTGRIGTRRGRP